MANRNLRKYHRPHDCTTGFARSGRKYNVFVVRERGDLPFQPGVFLVGKRQRMPKMNQKHLTFP